MMVSWLQRPRVVLALLALLYGGWIAYVVYWDRPFDFYQYYLSAYGFSHGIDVYALGAGDIQQAPQVWASLAAATGVRWYAPPYRYPPLTAFMVWPLTILGPRPAAAIWLVASAVAFVAAAALLGRASRLPAGVPLACALLLGFVPPLTTLYAGQVNGFVLFGLALAYTNLRRSNLGLGVGLAVATMLKLVPLAHLALLAWRGRWRAVLIGGGTIAGLLFVSLPLVGSSGLVSYLQHGIALGQPGSLVPDGANQALNGLLSRLLVQAQAAGYLADPADVGRWLWLGATMLLVAATAVLCWGGPDDKRRGDLGGAGGLGWELQFALVTTTVTLITPYTWYHQLVLLLIPMFVLVENALMRPALRWILVPLAAGYLATDIHGLVWHRLEPYPLAVSTPLLTAAMLWVLLAWLIAREKLARMPAAARPSEAPGG